MLCAVYRVKTGLGTGRGNGPDVWMRVMCLAGWADRIGCCCFAKRFPVDAA